ncbi:amidophosphoribosyltransferase [Zhaonella formicivorans]|uniref:amidophosphoribosyltransferase n=1 Tax=Zhaonella formicivorans TaxID=2528593 RepID=UPI0010EE7346|nr:amidophosphoribosyltransferase [Zhaonella formicivorans]
MKKAVFPLEEDKPREECGVFGIYAPGEDVARHTYYGLCALQHRGQESAGIAVANGHEIKIHKNMGLVTEVFAEDIFKQLKGNLAIGHVRYSTTGESSIANAQPLISPYNSGSIALAHNGHLVDAVVVRSGLLKKGLTLQTTSDSEVLLKFIASFSSISLPDALKKCMAKLRGAYSLVVMTEKQLIGMRDRRGMRPLCLGRFGKGYVLASETCALDSIGAEFIRDIKPGEIVCIDENGLNSLQVTPACHRSLCIFEYIYLARPDSIIDGEQVKTVRLALGRQLARECPTHADVVVPVPDSGKLAALGYATALGTPLQEGLKKNLWVGRNFIQPTQILREKTIKLKFRPVKEVVQSKSVALVDDSLVRGTTGRQIVKMLRDAGVKEVHLLVSSPPIRYPCYFGIDISDRKQLLAARYSLEEIKSYIGVDSLHYLSLENVLQVMQAPAEEFCLACFNGEYPIEIAALGKCYKII